jgi:hypothetical protein
VSTALQAPDPGSLGAVIQSILILAKANGHSAASVRLNQIPSKDVGRSPDYGPDVKVKVVYRDGTDDVVRLDRAWSLFSADVPIVALDCPDDPLPAVFIAAAMFHDATGLRHDLVVINRLRGQLESLVSKAKVAGQPLGKTMRGQVFQYAQQQEKTLAKKALAKLSREAQYAGQNNEGSDIFAAGVAGKLMESPTKRGLDPGRPAVQFSYKTVDPQGVTTIILVSDPDFDPDHVGVLATAGVAELAVDEYGRTDLSLLSANVWNKPLEYTTTDDDGNDHNREIVPSAALSVPVLPPDLVDWARTPGSHPDDQREWTDSTGDAGSALADNDMDLETALAHIWTDNEVDGAMELARRWRDAGLDDREITVWLCLQAGMTTREVGGIIKRHHTTVHDVAKRAAKKLGEELPGQTKV